VAAIRKSWEAALEDRIHVGGEVGWKALGACTYDDLIFAAEERRGLASRSLAMAERFTMLAEHMKKHGARTVVELSDHAYTSKLFTGVIN
jgi:hypothetical protein